MPRQLHPSDILELNPAAQIVNLPDNRIAVRHSTGLTLLDGISPEIINELKSTVDGLRSAESVYTELKQKFGKDFTKGILQQLTGEFLLVKNSAFHTGDMVVAPSQIAVVGGGALAERIAGKIGAAVLNGGLNVLPEKLELVIVTLEYTTYQTLFSLQKDLLQKGLNSLFVTLDADGIRIGPTVVPGMTPCFGCAQLSSFPFRDFPAAESLAASGGFHTLSLEEILPASVPEILKIIQSEAKAFLEPDGLNPTVGAFHFLPKTGRRRFIEFFKNPDCPLCGSFPEAEAPGAKASLVRHRLVRMVEQKPGIAIPPPPQNVPRHIGILGGGTAGYLTALAFRKKLPWVHVSLIESSDMPIIGVGEATTPLMPQFLHVDLGLDIHEFFREVKPAFKMGIRFEWGQGKEDYFQYPFGPMLNLETSFFEKNIRNNSLWSMLMAADKIPVTTDGEDSFHSFLDTNTAYHLDNKRFVAYLQKTAASAGIAHHDATIREVELTDDGENVQALIAADGRRFQFDLYVDCTGFASLLLGKSLQSEFIGFEKSLFNDSAIIASVPHGGRVKPYTTAEAMSAGWCWNTPQPEEDHRGYVFSSAFLTPEEAASEMRMKNPGMSDWKLIKFRAGRRRHFWKGNVVAMGNAYGFVEPLESTALHLLIRQIGMLVRAFPMQAGENGIRSLLNRKVGDYWDYLSWFLSLHFKFNRKQDSPYWQACREEADVSLFGELIDLFRERGPLACLPPSAFSFDYPDPLWGAEGIDTILLGQEVPTRLPRPAISQKQWQQWLNLSRRMTGQSLSQAAAFGVFEKKPELLTQMVQAFRMVGPAFGSNAASINPR